MAVFQVPIDISEQSFNLIIDHFGAPIDVTSYGPGEECENKLLFWDIDGLYPNDYIGISINTDGIVAPYLIFSICQDKTLEDLLEQKRQYDNRKMTAA
jgi:hypothetical protein